jgi:hypothetical protein
MRQHATVLIHHSDSPGVSLPEYCVLIVLVGVLCVAGLKAMGSSASNLLEGSIQQLDLEGTQSVKQASAKETLNKTASQSTDTRLASGNVANANETVQASKNSGSMDQPALELGSSDSSSGTNVSSSEGQQSISSDGMETEVASTINAASKLEELAKATNDPALKNYYNDLARWTYYLGGTEGVLSQVKGLGVNNLLGENRVYSARNALHDLMTYKDKLASLLNNPPKNVPRTAVQAIKPLTTSSLQIARSYIAANSQFINRNGSIKASINAAITTTDPSIRTASDAREATRSYAHIVQLSTMRQRVKRVLTTQPAGSQAVVATFTNGTTIDSKPTTP